MKNKAVLIGTICAIVQAIIYSTMGTIGKMVYATGWGTGELLIGRYIMTGILVGIALLVWHKVPLMSRNKIVYVEGIFFFLSSWFYYLAIDHITAGMTSVLFYLYPALVAIMAAVVFRERLNPGVVLCILASFVGVIFISGALVPGAVVLDAFGVLCACASCLAFAIYTIMLQKNANCDHPLTVTFTLNIVELVFSLVIFNTSIPAVFSPNMTQVLLIIAVSLLNTSLPVLLYMVAINRIGATKASLLGMVEAPSCLFIAWLVLGETLTVSQVIGTVLVVAAVCVITVQTAKSGKEVKKEKVAE